MPLMAPGHPMSAPNASGRAVPLRSTSMRMLAGLISMIIAIHCAQAIESAHLEKARLYNERCDGVSLRVSDESSPHELVHTG